MIQSSKPNLQNGTSSKVQIKQKFPFVISSIDSETNAELLQYFHGELTGFVQVGPEKYFFPKKYINEAEAYYNFEARDDDVWVVTFPRSGTTWTQELVWLVANNLDFETARNKLLTERFPFFEFSLFIHPKIKEQLIEENKFNKKKLQFIQALAKPGYEAFSEIKSRRFIKTHFPFSLLPPSVMKKKCKVIYVARNPKDVAVSYYHLNRLYRTQGYVGDFKRFWTYFEKSLNPWMPYYSHLKEASVARNESNVLFLQYENMLTDLRKSIVQVAEFLECKLNDEGIENLSNHLNISNFRNNLAVNGHEMLDVGILNRGETSFIRNGMQGMQKEFAEDPLLEERADKWIKQNSF